MTYHTKFFHRQSATEVEREINSYLAANLTFVAINISISMQGANCNAVLLYSKP